MNKSLFVHLFPAVVMVCLVAVTAILSSPACAQEAEAPKAGTSSGRSLLRNSFVKLTKDKRLKIVVIGNSVTHGHRGENRVSFYHRLYDC